MQSTNFETKLAQYLYWTILVLIVLASIYVLYLGFFAETRALGDPYYEYDVSIWDRAPLALVVSWLVWGISGILWVLSYKK